MIPSVKKRIMYVSHKNKLLGYSSYKEGIQNLMCFKSTCCIWMAGSSKGKWQTHLSWSTLAIVQTEPSQGVTDYCLPTKAVALWKPWMDHLFFVQSWEFRMNRMRMGVNDKGDHCLWGTAKEFRQQSSWGAPRKGVERGLRQWVLSGVPLVSRREERSRGKVQISGGKESTYWSIAETRVVIKESICWSYSKKKATTGLPTFLPFHARLSSPPQLSPPPNFWGQLSCVSGMCGAAGQSHI